jgi:hypothetical protein
MKFITRTLNIISILFALIFLTSFKNQMQGDANNKTELEYFISFFVHLPANKQKR